MPWRKPWDATATLLLPHAPSPGGSLPLPSQGISSGSPGCCNVFGRPCPPKQSTVYCPGFWRLHSPKANSRHWRRPEIPPQPLLSCLGLLDRNWVLAVRPIPDHWRWSCSDVSQLLVARPLDTLGHQFHPFFSKMEVVTELMAKPSIWHSILQW